ncbi:MAG: ATP-binding protein [Halopseudomonas aestusnigri]
MSVYGGARQVYWGNEFDRISDRAALYNSTLVSALKHYQYLPFILARDPIVFSGLKIGETQILNQRLEIFAKQAQVNHLYIMDTKGKVIAASNWRAEQTFIGKTYAFRPYFQTALTGRRGEFFAIGATTLVPGYFVAEPIFDRDDEVIGVATMKVDLGPLIQSWADGGEKIFVSNSDGIVVLSTDPVWKYRSLQPLSTEALTNIEQGRQFLNKPLSALNIEFLPDNELRLGAVNYLYQVSSFPILNWNLHYLAAKDVIIQRSQHAVLIASIIMSILLAGYLLIRSARIKRALCASEEDSRSLRKLNEELEREIDERRRAELRLALTQKELKQASKLAALGQLAASVSHELGQPISAMQNYLAFADLPDNKMDGETIDVMLHLNRLVARMGKITKQLKFFASPQTISTDAGVSSATVSGTEVFHDVDLRDVIEGVREIMGGNIQLTQTNLKIELPKFAVIIRGDRLRLEQVLINLVRNSLDAMKDNDGQLLEVNLFVKHGTSYINVLDRGPGLPKEISEQLFEPFVTTKSSGEGMGLGLAISASIVEDHGGELKARTRNTGGAEFSMAIPLFQTGDT